MRVMSYRGSKNEIKERSIEIRELREVENNLTIEINQKKGSNEFEFNILD